MAEYRVTLFVHVDIEARNDAEARTRAEDLKRWELESLQEDKARWVKDFDVDYSIEQS